MPEPSMTNTHEITMVLPADSRFVATARVTTASLAAEHEFSIDDIEDLRVGVNELVAIVVEWCEDNDAPDVELRWTLAEHELCVHARASTSSGEASDDPLDAITRQIVDHVADGFELGAGWGSITKRRGA